MLEWEGAERSAFSSRPLPVGEFASGRNLLGKGIREVRLIYAFLLVAFLVVAQSGMAQSAPDQSSAATAAPEKTAGAGESAEATGPTAFIQIEGNNFNMGTVATYDFNLGYKINPHVSVDIGLPLYTTRTPFSIVATTDWRFTTIIGAPYLDVRYDTKRSGTNITSLLTGAVGTNMVKTYSDGRFTLDWFNHFDRSYQILSYDAYFSPFANLEAGTGTIDRQVFPRPFEIARPYETLGNIGSGEAGGAFTIKKHYRLEGSAYGLLPVGPQKVFSKMVSPDNLLGGDGHHNRWWDEYFETSNGVFNGTGAGPSKIARDNGYGMYLTVTDFKRIHIQKDLTLMLGYTRSVHYDYGSAFIMLRYDFTGLLRSLTTGE